MRRAGLVALLLLLPASFSPSPSAAQSGPFALPDTAGRLPADLRRAPAAGFSQGGAIDPAAYVLGPGDLLSLEVLGRIARSDLLRIDPEGNLWIPDLGPISLGGLTLATARERVAERFQRGTRGLAVFLRLVDLRRFKVYVSGEVRSPGAYEATAVSRVSELVERAGGVTAEGSRRNIELRAPDREPRSADLVRFDRTNERRANPTLLDGDQIYVPRRGRLVLCFAPVPYPGEYEYRRGDSLSTLIRIAGGFLPEALLERGFVLRFTDETHLDTIRIDLPAVVAGETDLSLQADDQLFVPAQGDFRQSYFVTIRGEVERPGTYPLAEGRARVTALVELAGGLTEVASPQAVLVVRDGAETLQRDPEFDRLSRLSRAEMTDAEYQTFRTKLASSQGTFLVDLTAIESAARSGAAPDERDVLLRSGDVVIVEKRPYAVRVSGEVRKPGLVQYESGLTGRDYIRLAGGFGAKAKKGGVRLTRSATGQTLHLKDVDRIEPGDLIYVPDKPDTNWLAVARDVLSFAASVGTLVIVLRR